MMQRYCSYIIIYRNDLETVRFLIPPIGITHSYRLDQSIREICVSHPSFKDNERLYESKISNLSYIISYKKNRHMWNK